MHRSADRPGLQSMETRYRGYRMRSRLEGRWAVVLDHLDIAWLYEPQGWACTHRLTAPDGDTTFGYLPDFWLPDLQLHAEVKATLTGPECVRLLDAAAALSSNNARGCHQTGGHDLVVFGNLPDAGLLPVQLHMHNGGLAAWPFDPLYPLPVDACPFAELGVPRMWHLAADHGGESIFADSNLVPSQLQGRMNYDDTAILTGRWLCRGAKATPRDAGTWGKALNAARAARFEHGESGTPDDLTLPAPRREGDVPVRRGTEPARLGQLLPGVARDLYRAMPATTDDGEPK